MSGKERAAFMRKVKKSEHKAFMAEGKAREARGETKHQVRVVS